jgi:hypothetical protein
VLALASRHRRAWLIFDVGQKNCGMITKEKLAIYKGYRGDVDGWARANKKSERIISNDDWHLIDELLLQLRIVKKKQATESFTSETMRRLKAAAAEDLVSEELMSLA